MELLEDDYFPFGIRPLFSEAFAVLLVSGSVSENSNSDFS